MLRMASWRGPENKSEMFGVLVMALDFSYRTSRCGAALAVATTALFGSQSFAICKAIMNAPIIPSAAEIIVPLPVY